MTGRCRRLTIIPLRCPAVFDYGDSDSGRGEDCCENAEDDVRRGIHGQHHGGVTASGIPNRDFVCGMSNGGNRERDWLELTSDRGMVRVCLCVLQVFVSLTD